MRRAFRRLACAAAAAVLLLPLWGCQLKQLHVLIEDFDSSAVEGLLVWRLADGTQLPEEAGWLLFSEPYRMSGQEVIDYTQIHPDGSEGLTLQTIVERDPRRPDVVALRVYYERSRAAPEGWFRVSTFNAHGASEPSIEKTYL
jgi:hypothetical protein